MPFVSSVFRDDLDLRSAVAAVFGRVCGGSHLNFLYAFLRGGDNGTSAPCLAVHTRTVNLVRELKEKPGADELRNICGLPLSTYPSSVTLRWMLDNLPDVKSAYDDGRAAFGTVDSWLIYNLNGGPQNKRLVTDVTNASRTMFMNLETLQYDDRLLKFFDIVEAV